MAGGGKPGAGQTAGLTIEIVDLSGLSDAEQLLLKAFPAGGWVDLRTGDPRRDEPADGAGWGPERTIRAGVIACLLLGEAVPGPGKVPAVRLRGARVAGRLDLMGATVAHALVCEQCYFDEAPRFVEATTRTIRLAGDWLPGFNAARMRLEGIFSLHRTAVDGMLILDRAKITGEAYLRAAVIEAGADGAALAADGLTVDGDLDIADMSSRGSVVLRGARITGSVYAAGARISRPGADALNADHAVIGGTFAADRMVVEGKTRLRNTRVGGNMRLRAARLDNPGDVVLGAGGLTVEGGMWCREGFTASGEVRLTGARIGGGVEFAGARLSQPGGIALCLDRAVVADVDAAGLVVTGGTVTVAGTQITGRLNLAEAELRNGPGTSALVADGSAIGTDVILTRAKVSGEVEARAIRVGGRVHLQQAVFDNGSGTAVRLTRADISVDVLCDHVTVIGKVRMAGTKVGGSLYLWKSRLRNPGGKALDAPQLQVTEIVLKPAEPVQGSVCLSNARTGVLIDDPELWPDRMELDGFTYESLDPLLPARERLRWLARDSRVPQPQIYEHLAAYYTKIGQPAEARRVLYAKERHQRPEKGRLARAWGVLQDITVGYGYQPWRAVLWFAALLAIGSAIYAISPPPALTPASAPHFSPVAYTLDLLLPVINLGQKYAFNPDGLEQWFSYLLIAAGWILATTIIAGVARVLTRK
jgi:hypothetical protein